MPDFAIETASASDGEELCELERSCPQGEKLSITSERKDYFFRSRLYGNDHTLVIRGGNRIVGAMAATLKRLMIGGEPRTGALIYDLRLHPAARKALSGVVLVRTWNRMEAWAREAGASFAYGFVKGDNRTMRGSFGRKGYSEIGWMRILGRPVFRGLGPRRSRKP